MNSASEIAKRIRNGQIKAETVMQHFIKQAQLAHEQTNYKQIASGTSFSESDFPLLGVPVSIKDVFDMKEYPGVCGCLAQINQKPEEDAAVIKLLRECGAIPFCKTNVCQFAMTIESSNPVYGKTTHPIDANYTSGGSTSGEAPLIKLGGSVLGIGSDIGGSLRVPAHFCGVYTLKPTPRRIPERGHIQANAGQESILLSIGPMANNVKDLKLFMKSLLDKHCWRYDELGIPLPFREFKITKPLKVGYNISDGIFPASPACQRAVFEVVEILKLAGHEVSPFEIPDFSQVLTLAQTFLTVDQLSDSLCKLTGEGIDETISNYVKITTLPNLIKKTLECFLIFFSQTLSSSIISNSRRLTLEEMWEKQNNRNQIQQKFQSQWQKQELDVLIMPPIATPAFKHGHFLDVAPGMAYSTFINLLNLPSGIIPVTCTSPQDEVSSDWLLEQLPSNIKPELLHDKLYFQACPDVPFPVGVQVVGMRFDDEKILSIMELIDDLLQSNLRNIN